MKSLRKQSLIVKFIIIVSLVLALVFGTILVVNLKPLMRVSKSNGELEAFTAGNEYSITIEKTMVEMQSTVKLLADILAESRSLNKLDREDVVAIMTEMIKKRPEITGLSTIWEPNAFDGNDKSNVNKTEYDDVTGRFIPYVVRKGDDIVVEPLRDYELEGAGDYYLLPKASKKLTYLEPYSYEVQGEEIQMISILQPILDKSGAFLGEVGLDLSLTYLQENAELYKPLGGYVSLLTESGLYAANPNDKESILKPFGDTPEKEALWQGIKSGDLSKGYTLNSKGNLMLRVFQSIKLPGSDQVWYTQAAVSKDTIMKSYLEARTNVFIIIVIAMLILAAILAALLWIMVIKPLKNLSVKLQFMSEGDLTQRIEVRTSDEFGIMAGHFNHMTARLREMFQHVADLTMNVGATSQQLTASAEQTGIAAETIADSIGRVAEGSQIQSECAGESSQSMSEFSLGVQRIADSSSTVSTSADEVANQTRLGSQGLQAAVNQMAELKQSVEETSKAIERLNERSVQIGHMIGLITDISKQTNLLALNASIEASRAGEHGRGFAVVATEIRKLAEQTKDAASEITDLVEHVRNDTKQASQAMTVGNEKVRQGVQSVSDSEILFTSILTEMTNVNEQIQEVSAAAEQMTASTEQISASVSQLAELAADASADSQSVAAASEEQLASMEEISASADALSTMVQELLERLSQFKI